MLALVCKKKIVKRYTLSRARHYGTLFVHLSCSPLNQSGRLYSTKACRSTSEIISVIYFSIKLSTLRLPVFSLLAYACPKYLRFQGLNGITGPPNGSLSVGCIPVANGSSSLSTSAVSCRGKLVSSSTSSIVANPFVTILEHHIPLLTSAINRE